MRGTEMVLSFYAEDFTRHDLCYCLCLFLTFFLFQN
jgi:hypothetical protein